MLTSSLWFGLNLFCRLFQDSIIEYLRVVGGGHSCGTIISPNTQDQYSNIQLRLRDIELNPFMQVHEYHNYSVDVRLNHLTVCRLSLIMPNPHLDVFIVFPMERQWSWKRSAASLLKLHCDKCLNRKRLNVESHWQFIVYNRWMLQ